MSWRNRWLLDLAGPIVLLAFAFTPAYAGLEDRPLESDEAETLPPRTVSASVGWEYAEEDNGDVEITIPLDATYGITKHFELGIQIPVLSLNPEEDDDAAGVGDIRLRPEHVFLEESRILPSLAWGAIVKFPTGSESEDLGSGRTDYAVELLASKSVGPTLGSIHLTHTFVGGDDDVFGPAANLAYFVNDRLTLVGEWLGEISEEKDSLSSLLGFIYEIADGIALDTGVSFGLINADLDWSVRVGITYEFTFRTPRAHRR
ncbi:MAG: hypothetical protein ACE5JD_03055 [Candidatus Methylomirabilia bacterium]